MNRRSLNGYVSTNWGGNAMEVDNYLTIVALEDGLTAKLSVNACEYCVDGDGNWKTLSAATNTEAINTGQTLSFRGNLTPNSSNGIGTFTISKNCNLEGNCMSLLFGDEAADNTSLSGKNYAFYKLFYNCTKIKSVSSGFLPATTLASYCYYYMFYGCTTLTQASALPATKLTYSCYEFMFSGCNSLTTTPELPSMTLASNCYDSMFKDCTSLVNAPALPATTLAYGCYDSMFRGCTNLTQSPELPATTLASSCYYYMFYGTNVLPDCSNINFSSSSVVSSGGLQGLFAGTKVTDGDLERILPKNNNGKYCLPATTLKNYCYHGMFQDCTSLTTAPELPATRLADSCYYSMFQGCTSLTTSPELPATTLASDCYKSMFRGCTSLTTVPSVLPATTLKLNCYYCMFYNCTSLTTAPELPATTLVEMCYHMMFGGCSKLNYIKAMFTTSPTTKYTDTWVYRVASKGTFVKNKNATWSVTGNYGIPSGWTVQTA